MTMNRKSGLYSLLVTAILLAVGIVLPFLTGNVQVLGQAISPLHIPVLICGLTCGWYWGMGLGIVLPLLRSVLFGMPPLVPVAIPMAFEMAAVFVGLLRCAPGQHLLHLAEWIRERCGYPRVCGDGLSQYPQIESGCRK